MRTFIFFLLIGWFIFLLVACEGGGGDGGASEGGSSSLASTPSPTASQGKGKAEATVVVLPTPPRVTVKVWGPEALSPQASGDEGVVLREQVEAFEVSNPNVDVVYEPKPMSGPAGVLNYVRSARAVAPTVLPDLVILSSAELEQAVQMQLLFPLDEWIAEGSRNDFYPFAVRDTIVDGKLFALPLSVQVEHGVIRDESPSITVTKLEELLADEAPTWLFAGQARAEGEMSNALLLQLMAINEQRFSPTSLPSRDKFVALFTTLQAAGQGGAIPQQVLSLDEGKTLYERLRSGQADLIESNSRQYMLDNGRDILFAQLPTLTGSSTTVIDGYLIALTTEEPTQQQAAIGYLKWLLAPSRLAQWNRAYNGLPPRRSSLKESIDDEAYQQFLAQQLENGWLRPSGTNWHDFSQIMQEQFRAVMLEQSSPTEAVDTILDTYAP
ncbi:MAG: extracellular solute-binding protein [Ardenticatenaceae bacterium]